MNIHRITAFLISMVSLASFADGYDHFGWYDNIVLFPHQIAISDLLCTGTVISNSNSNVVISVDETLWGTSASSNISVRCIDGLDRLSLVTDERYLVFAFTNNWWSSSDDNRRETCLLVNFMSVTNRAANVFSDGCRLLDPKRSAVSFDTLADNGTNYWDATRTFITNFLDVTRIQCNEKKAFHSIDSIINDTTLSAKYPRWLLLQFVKYEYFRYKNSEPLSRDSSR